MYNRSTFASLAAAAGFALITLGGAANAQHSKAPKAKITTAQANAVALKKYPGKVVGKTPLENEEGTWQYGVMVQSGRTLREVMVNAQTGKIDSVEVTTKAKEAREKANEEAAEAHKTSPGHTAAHNGAAAHQAPNK